MGFKLIYDGCCLQWVQFSPLILLGSYTTEDSSGNPIIDPYKPYINEQNIDLFYVKETYMPDGQPIPHKHSEDSTAPELNAMSYFVGVQDNGDDTFTNYNFTPAQLIAYVAPMLRLPYTVETTSETITVEDIDSKPVIEIAMPNQTLTRNQFTQVGNAITYTGNSFYENDQIIFKF